MSIPGDGHVNGLWWLLSFVGNTCENPGGPNGVNDAISLGIATDLSLRSHWQLGFWIRRDVAVRKREHISYAELNFHKQPETPRVTC